LPAAHAKNNRQHVIPLGRRLARFSKRKWAAIDCGACQGSRRGAVFLPVSFSKMKGELDPLMTLSPR
jgi:hypothetical protein